MLVSNCACVSSCACAEGVSAGVMQAWMVYIAHMLTRPDLMGSAHREDFLEAFVVSHA